MKLFPSILTRTILMSALVVLSGGFLHGDSIDFEPDLDEFDNKVQLPFFGPPTQVGFVRVLDGSTVIMGTYSSSTAGVSFVDDPENPGQPDVIIDPFLFSNFGTDIPKEIFEGNGTAERSVDVKLVPAGGGDAIECEFKVCIGPGFSTLSLTDENQDLSAANRADQVLQALLDDHFGDGFVEGRPSGFTPGGPLDGGNNDTADNDADPVSTSTREFFFFQQLLGLNAPLLPVQFSVHHGSRVSDSAFFDHLPEDFVGSHMPFARKVDVGGGGFFFQLQFQLGLGFRVTFENTNGSTNWNLQEGERWKFTVEETANYYYLRDPNTQCVWIFKKHPVGTFIEPAYCLQKLDRNGNTLTYTQPADPTVEGPSSVTDGLGRTLNFTYGPVPGAVNDTRNYLTEVTDHTGRKIVFTYFEHPAGIRVQSITDAIGNDYTCTYDANGYMASRTLPRGNTPVTTTFETVFGFFGDVGAVTSQTNAFGETWTFEDVAGGVLGDVGVRVTNPDSSKRDYHHSEASILSGVVDELGKVMAFEPDDQHDRFKSYTDREGNTGRFEYDDNSGHLVKFTNERGDVTTYTYTDSVPQTFNNPEVAESVLFSFPDLARIDYPDGTFATYAYDPNGNVISTTDRDADTSTTTRNARGQILTYTTPEGGIITNTYDATTALLLTTTNTDTGTYVYDYDLLSRIVRRTNPDATDREYTYDGLDRTVTATDEEGVVTRFTYDANSNLVDVTRAFGLPEEQSYGFEYDALDRLIRTFDPSGNPTRRDFDYHNDPIRTVLRDGVVRMTEYDLRREVVQLTDEIGSVTKIERTKHALPAVVTSPLGRETKFEYDPAKVLVEVTDNSGDTSSVALDEVSTPIKLTDGLGRVTDIAQDGQDRTTGRDEPTLGLTAYEYDGNGRLSKLTDAAGKVWNFTHTGMGRRTNTEDPLNRNCGRTYDSRGRLDVKTYPDGITCTTTYHPDSQIAGRTYSDGLAHTYTYDGLNRMTQCVRTIGGKTDTVSRSYDVRSNPTSTTVNGISSTATFDVRDRVKTVTYPDGLTTVTYTYDPRGLVVKVEDSLTGTTVDLEYDADRLLRKVTRSNGRVTDYAYDAETLLESITHDSGAVSNWTYNSADEPTNIAESGYPADGSAGLVAGVQTFTHDNAHQISTVGFFYDPRGRPTTDTTRSSKVWDSNNRLISVTKGSTTVTYCYDALGRITSRTEGGIATQYAYNDAIGMSPILGEKTGASFDRLYVALPNGKILYLIEKPAGAADVRFYHYGQTCNTRFLTDAAGTVTDSYAYDAYGRLLEKNGASTQFYTYVGGLGVRLDEVVCLYHMRHRYYDAETARFLSPDPIFETVNRIDGKHAHPYHYTSGQPTHQTDPLGLIQRADDVGQTASGSGNSFSDADFAIGLDGRLIAAQTGATRGTSVDELESPYKKARDKRFETAFYAFVGELENNRRGALDAFVAVYRASNEQITLYEILSDVNDYMEGFYSVMEEIPELDASGEPNSDLTAQSHITSLAGEVLMQLEAAIRKNKN
ncbi:MAG: RHS repeat-associated core domain-containing protein [Verrucomicrobiota bacterium]